MLAKSLILQVAEASAQPTSLTFYARHNDISLLLPLASSRLLLAKLSVVIEKALPTLRSDKNLLESYEYIYGVPNNLGNISMLIGPFSRQKMLSEANNDYGHLLLA